MNLTKILIIWVSIAVWLLISACSYSFIDFGRHVKIETYEADKEHTWQDSSKAGYGTIRGLVRDFETCEGIPGVSVRLEDTLMGSAASFDGSFFIENIPPGKYTITIKTIWYNPIIVKDLDVRADEIIEMEIEMQREPGNFEFGDYFGPPLIDRYQTSNQKTIVEDDIETMPVSTADDILKKTQGFVR